MNFKILAFDTSTEVCSVALMIDDNVYESSESSCFRNERKILSMIDKLLSDAGITLQYLDCIVCSSGPGSFVGVRVGISLAQGLALGADLPLIQFSSLEVLAQGIWRLIGSRRVLATINARLGELYLACYYRDDNNRWLGKDTELIITVIDMCSLVSKLDGQWVLVGTGWNRYPIFFSESILQIHVRQVLFPSALDMLSLAIINLKNNDLLTANQIHPVYLEKMKWNKVSE